MMQSAAASWIEERGASKPVFVSLSLSSSAAQHRFLILFSGGELLMLALKVVFW
jgi:hypothetical protein